MSMSFKDAQTAILLTNAAVELLFALKNMGVTQKDLDEAIKERQARIDAKHATLNEE